ncbi:MAG: helix-turn-helix domain-containing protein, partial [Caulobacteraceae bacterium]
MRDVAAAALACFLERGYRLTQVSDVSARLGVSVGSLYRYVESKEALFHVAALEAAGELAEPEALPVKVSGHDETVAAIGEMAAGDELWSVLHGLLRAETPANVKEEAGAVGRALYDAIFARAILISLLDRCAHEIPALAVVFDENVRHRLVNDLTAWVIGRGFVGSGGKADAEALARGAMEAVA